MNRRRIYWSAAFLAMAAVLPPFAVGAARADEPVNLALHKPAFASSIENDEHDAAQANDGDADTRWCADDEPEGTPDWWMVDLRKPADLSGCQIHWPYDGMHYRYKLEGSAEGKQWSLLSDQTKATATTQVQDLKLADAKGVRYVKITITGLDDGCSPSICEVKVFGINSK
jgi:hypothetical protein